MLGSFCMHLNKNTIYVTYGNLKFYNTNDTISSKIIVKKEGDTSNPPIQICFIPSYSFAFDKMVTLSYQNKNRCS